ncbi:MAG TPA: biosynthetic arginine decarboxylase, partial [Spirochaetota bacterium]|nr:biosynthetic arginine decarboxylase [Spirochaetota bacterium]
CNLQFIDVGGGLGVDYDGSQSVFASSANYNLQEYANAIVYGIKDVCGEENVTLPVIISESGRAIVAHHSFIITEVFTKIEKRNLDYNKSSNKDTHKLVNEIIEIRNNLNKENANETYHDLVYLKYQAKNLFDLGYLDLESKAIIETYYWEIASEIIKIYKDRDYIPDEIKELQVTISDQYLLNFSVFQSLPDFWALGQLFPIVPIHRLLEKPEVKVTLSDITCDSDGKINKFIDLNDVQDLLPLHKLNGNPYYIGFFITGAYQDTLGDMHNLFGRINEIHIFMDSDEEKGWYIEETIEGSNIVEVLDSKQYDKNELIRDMKQQIDFAIKTDKVKPSEGMKLLSEYEKALEEYTYLKR